MLHLDLEANIRNEWSGRRIFYKTGEIEFPDVNLESFKIYIHITCIVPKGGSSMPFYHFIEKASKTPATDFFRVYIPFR